MDLMTKQRQKSRSSWKGNALTSSSQLNAWKAKSNPIFTDNPEFIVSFIFYVQNQIPNIT
jgi:hypothetical protein